MVGKVQIDGSETGHACSTRQQARNSRQGRFSPRLFLKELRRAAYLYEVGNGAFDMFAFNQKGGASSRLRQARDKGRSRRIGGSTGFSQRMPAREVRGEHAHKAITCAVGGCHLHRDGRHLGDGAQIVAQHQAVAAQRDDNCFRTFQAASTDAASVRADRDARQRLRLTLFTIRTST